MKVQMIALAVLWLHFLACHTPLRAPNHVTPCGMRVFYPEGVPDLVPPAVLDQGEQVALQVLDGVDDIDSKALCAKVKNWYLQIGFGPGTANPSPSHTSCDGRNINLHRYDFMGVTHEFIHVAQGCGGCQEQGWLGTGIGAGPIDHHCLWLEKGLDAAIVKAANTPVR